jgi:predicted enzyme related to lactoylglutathione lyase
MIEVLRFYGDQLGFNVVADARFGPDDRWVAVAPQNGSAVLALVVPKPGSEDRALMGRATQISLITEDINATFDQWHSRGVRFDRPPQTASWGGISANFQDVDGNSFELLASNDMSREIEALRRATTEKLESERRGAQELEIAKQVQVRLFPQTLPPLKTLDYASRLARSAAITTISRVGVKTGSGWLSVMFQGKESPPLC